MQTVLVDALHVSQQTTSFTSGPMPAEVTEVVAEVTEVVAEVTAARRNAASW